MPCLLTRQEPESSFEELLHRVSIAYDNLSKENLELRSELNGGMPDANHVAGPSAAPALPVSPESKHGRGPGAQLAIRSEDYSQPDSTASKLRELSFAGVLEHHNGDLSSQTYIAEIKDAISVELSQITGVLKEHRDLLEDRVLNDTFQRQESRRTPISPTGESRSDGPRNFTSYEAGEDSEEKKKKFALTQSSKIWDPDEEDEKEEGFKCRKCVTKLVKTSWFEFVFCCIIISNTVYIGVETDYMTRNWDQPPPFGFKVVQYIYLSIFTLELSMRWIADGWTFLRSPINWAWNWLDIFVVAIALFEAGIEIAHELTSSKQASGSWQFGNVRVVRIIRIMRFFRILRISRIMRFLSALRTLVYSIIGTLTSLFWAIVLLVLIIYTFGVIFTQVAGDYFADNRPDLDTKNSEGYVLKMFWGSLTTSMYTLFMSIAAGISWESVVDPLFALGPLWPALFTIFIAFTYFAVLNIMTANFCQSAIECASHDQDHIISRQLAQKKAYIKLIERLYGCIDTNGSGSMSLAEMEMHFDDKAVQAYLSSLELEPQDAWSLFKLLGNESASGVGLGEFVSGCMKLRGGAKRIDQAGMMQKVDVLSAQLCELTAAMDEQFALLRRERERSQSSRNSYRTS